MCTAEILVCVEILLEGEAGVEGVILFNFFFTLDGVSKAFDCLWTFVTFKNRILYIYSEA